jgi:hypothetical protein
MEGNHLILIEHQLKNPTDNIILNGEKQAVFFLISARMSALTIFIKHSIVNLTSALNKKKKQNVYALERKK